MNGVHMDDMESSGDDYETEIMLYDRRRVRLNRFPVDSQEMEDQEPLMQRESQLNRDGK